jgi:hypothetical protein
MRGARVVGTFLADLLVGDDWRMSAGIVVSFALCFALSRAGIAAWWLPSVGVVLVLAYSLLRVTRPSRRGQPTAELPDAPDAGSGPSVG